MTLLKSKNYYVGESLDINVDSVELNSNTQKMCVSIVTNSAMGRIEIHNIKFY